MTSLIKTLFTDQLSSLRINPQEPMLTIQSARSKEESVKRLLVPHNTTTSFRDAGTDRFLVLERPALMEPPSNKVLVTWFLTRDSDSSDILASLIFYCYCFFDFFLCITLGQIIHGGLAGSSKFYFLKKLIQRKFSYKGGLKYSHSRKNCGYYKKKKVFSNILPTLQKNTCVSFLNILQHH